MDAWHIEKIKKKKENNNLPETTGVYMLWSKRYLLYIGKSSNLKRRILEHVFGRGLLQQRQVQPERISHVSYTITEDKYDAGRLEDSLLNIFRTLNNGTANWWCNNDLYPQWLRGQGVFK